MPNDRLRRQEDELNRELEASRLLYNEVRDLEQERTRKMEQIRSQYDAKIITLKRRLDILNRELPNLQRRVEMTREEARREMSRVQPANDNRSPYRL